MPATAAPVAKSHVLTFLDLKSQVENAPGEIIADMLPEESINVFLGESGQGKTPFLMQLAMSVALGRPFLSSSTRPTSVLWIDYENGQAQLVNLLDALCEHLQLPRPPDNLCFLHHPASPNIVYSSIKSFRPSLVIIDSLRGFSPDAEASNSDAAELITKLQNVAKADHVAFLLIHHLRKPDTKNPPPTLLASESTIEWSLQGAGSRSLINQSNVRMGFAEDTSGTDSIIFRYYYKLKGEFGPWFIGRQLDDSGYPIGYYRQSGLIFLPQAYRETYAKLPADFTFTDCKHLLKKSQNPVARFLKRCIGARVLEKRGEDRKHARYYKIDPPPLSSPTPEPNL